MPDIQLQIVQPNDHSLFQIIAEWYTSEWKIPFDKTIQRLQTITRDNIQLQVIMTINGLPIGTGGLYTHVGLVDRVPRLSICKHWLAQVYTTPAYRRQGHGAKLCNFIQDHAKKLGIDTIHLFTDTAEQLYTRLGWAEIERLVVGERNVVLMNKDLR